ncbi:MAG TPA: sialidase family protein [Casimicrobiaceae bacterium]
MPGPRSLTATNIALLAFALPVLWASMPATAADTLVSIGSPMTPFARSKQNEPALAVDPNNPFVLAAGANEEIDVEACAAGDPTSCPFTTGVGTSGIYFSFDGGKTWIQPTYTGWSARACLGPAACVPALGPIGTLPWYYEDGLVADGDASLAFGPRPGADGTFSWANGSRLYYANLTSNFSAQRSESAFKGSEAIAVSRTDDPLAASQGDKNAWLHPVIVSKQNAALFSDKETIWADNAQTSPYFGNVYVCNVAFRGLGLGGAPEPVILARSTDGGDTWTTRQISQAANTFVAQGRAGGRQGCTIRTDSHGVVYVFWSGSLKNQGVQLLSRSFDGGKTFEVARAVADVAEVGVFDAGQGDVVFDGVAGARTNSFPSVDIANGAPSGTDATDRIVMAWSDASLGLNQEQALVQYSDNQGLTWSTPINGAESADRPDFPAVAISPDGTDVYFTYMAFTTPFRTTTADPRPMQGVVRHASAALTDWATLNRGLAGDARASSANNLGTEFLGDYTSAIATRSYGAAVWTDVRDAADCPAVDAYRQSLVSGAPIAKPAPGTDCPDLFGNSDIFGGSYP